VLHDKIREAIFGFPPVEEPGDVWVLERGQYLPLVLEAPQHRLSVHAPFNQLDRHLHLELLVRPLSEVNLAHPAGAEALEQFVAPDRSAGISRNFRLAENLGGKLRGWINHEPVRLLTRLQQRVNLPPQFRIVAAGLVEKSRSLVRPQLLRRVKDSLEPVQLRRAHVALTA
jgi:hypothetical protein